MADHVLLNRAVNLNLTQLRDDRGERFGPE